MPGPAGGGSSTLYAALDDLKASRRIKADDDDAALTRALTAACRLIDRRCGRRFNLPDAPTARVFGLAGRVTPSGTLLVDDIGTTDGLVVEAGSTDAWTPTTEWEPGPANSLEQGWPITELTATGRYWSGVRRGGYWSGSSVRVTARWGWPVVPDEIAMAAVLLANRLYMRKDSPEGVAGSAEWGAIRLSRFDPDVQALIDPYVLPGIA